MTNYALWSIPDQNWLWNYELFRYFIEQEICPSQGIYLQDSHIREQRQYKSMSVVSLELSIPAVPRLYTP
jgi:hypothetical protein